MNIIIIGKLILIIIIFIIIFSIVNIINFFYYNYKVLLSCNYNRVIKINYCLTKQKSINETKNTRALELLLHMCITWPLLLHMCIT